MHRSKSACIVSGAAALAVLGGCALLGHASACADRTRLLVSRHSAETPSDSARSTLVIRVRGPGVKPGYHLPDVTIVAVAPPAAAGSAPSTPAFERSQSTTTDSLGDAIFTRLPRGRYRVFVTLPGYQPLVDSLLLRAGAQTATAQLAAQCH